MSGSRGIQVSSTLLLYQRDRLESYVEEVLKADIGAVDDGIASIPKISPKACVIDSTTPLVSIIEGMKGVNCEALSKACTLLDAAIHALEQKYIKLGMHQTFCNRMIVDAKQFARSSKSAVTQFALGVPGPGFLNATTFALDPWAPHRRHHIVSPDNILWWPRPT